MALGTKIKIRNLKGWNFTIYISKIRGLQKLAKIKIGEIVGFVYNNPKDKHRMVDLLKLKKSRKVYLQMLIVPYEPSLN